MVVIKKMDELRVDSIIVDIGCWWRSMDKDDDDKMMQAVDENTIANSIEECPAEVSPQEECSNWWEGGTAVQTDEPSSLREANLISEEDVATHTQDDNTTTEPSVGTIIKKKTKLKKLEKRGGEEGKMRLEFLRRYFPNTRMSPGGTETLTDKLVPMDISRRKYEVDAVENICSSPGSTAIPRLLNTRSQLLNPNATNQLTRRTI